MRQVRSIFISDVHLGTRACQAERLLAFLRDHDAQNLFLIGDIVDFWAMSRSIHWTESHNTVVQKILRRARHGEHVVFIPGNHDEALREYVGVTFGDIRVATEWIHEAADGRRYWLVHGDEYDQVTRHHRWVAILGDVGYNALVSVNHWLSRLRRLLRVPGYWSLAGYAKQKVKKAVGFIFDFERSLAHAAELRGVDGVICGHIHWPEDRMIGTVRYLNCGDWVDTCSAVVEHLDGRFEIVRWHERDWSVDADAESEPAPGTMPETVLMAAPEHAPIPAESRFVRRSGESCSKTREDVLSAGGALMATADNSQST